MAKRRTRRRRDPGLLSLALERDWTFAASVAAGNLVLGYVVLPIALGGNPLTGTLVAMLKPVTAVLAAVFGAIAVWKAYRAGGRSSVIDLGPGLGTEPTIGGGGYDTTAIADEMPWRPTAEADKPTEWSANVLAQVEWKRLEDLCCAFYREKGIAAETTVLGADGGVDIRLFQDEARPARTTTVVQCKAHNKPIGVKPIRELRGVMAHEGAEKGIFMAPSGYTEDARAFAESNRITLLDGKLFLAMIQRLPEASRNRLLDLATEGDWTTPTCPSCGERMVARDGSKGAFWGCPTYPRCRGKLPMRGKAAIS